jgi:hypothetical protein
MSAHTIQGLMDSLPERNLTTRMLDAVDAVAPGQWRNIVGFENAIRVITGETDEDLIQKVGERAIRLYNDRSQGYQRAVWLYETAESISNAMATAALANKAGEKVSLLHFISKITPKPDNAQAIDFGVKLVVEVVAFCMRNGLPGDGIGDFVKALTHYRDEARIRMAALICVDGLLPLGPDVLSKVLGALGAGGPAALQQSETFRRVHSLIPGGGPEGQLTFIQEGMQSAHDWMAGFTAQHALSPAKVLGGLQGFIDSADAKLDYVAAFLDLTTDYYRHTGIQSVARSLIERAVNEV